MGDEKKYKVPEALAADVGHALLKAGISKLPLVGAPAAELFRLIVSPPLEKRRSEWMQSVGDALRKLEEKMDIVLEELQNNDKFIDAAMDATQIALRTSEKEKLEALQNALLNAALPNSPEEEIQKMFFSFIDLFTVFHIKILELFRNPSSDKYGIYFKDITSGPLRLVLEKAFPNLKGKKSFYDQIWKDLYLRGLVSIEGLHGIMSYAGIMTKRTTEMGDAFLDFISNPLSKVNH